MQLIDEDQRKAILMAKGNIVINASAGTGKTRSTIDRIIVDQNNNNNYQTFAAITFTRKAAKEILDRLGRDKGEGFVGTNDKFVLLEVIQPFMYDVFGKSFKKTIKPDYTNDSCFDTFEEGIAMINTKSTINKYSDIHKNFSFQLGLYILKNSLAARRYLKSKYFRIYIDEYQDSDKDMHNFFMYICKEIGINLFIVGDAKQSIYSWRGGYVKGFKDIIVDTDFNTYKLIHNFRSNIQIQNYANIFMDDVRDYYQLRSAEDKVNILQYDDIEECIDYIKSKLDPTKKSAILVRNNDFARSLSALLIENGMEFVYLPASPLDNTQNESEHVWIVRVVVLYLLKERFSEYDVMEEIPDPESHELRSVRELLINIKNSIYQWSEFLANCKKLYQYFGYQHSEKTEREIDLLFTVVNEKKYVATYNPEKYNNIVGTIHSAKGLQYKQVVIMASDYNLSKEDDRNLHYVAVTRPEEILIILAKNNNSYSHGYLRELSRCIDKTRAIKGSIEYSNVANLISL